MIWSLTMAVLAAPGFGSLAPTLARRLPPSWATWFLAVGGLVAAFASGTAVAMLAFLLLGHSAEIAHHLQWSHITLTRSNEIPLAVSVLAAAALVLLVVRAVRASATRALALRRCYSLAADLGSAELVVTEDDLYRAVAVPGRPGKIVLSKALLSSVDPVTRTAVIVHEQAHLRHRHHLALAAGVISAAANPFLSPVREAIALSTERWADEDAGAVVDRRAVAAALVQFSGSSPRSKRAQKGHDPAPKTALSALGEGVRHRILSLLNPPLTAQPWWVALSVILSLVPAVILVYAWTNVEGLYELAQDEFMVGR